MNVNTAEFRIINGVRLAIVEAYNLQQLKFLDKIGHHPTELTQESISLGIISAASFFNNGKSDQTDLVNEALMGLDFGGKRQLLEFL